MDLVFDQSWCLGALPQAMEGPGELRLGSGLAPAKPRAGQSGGRRGTMEKKDRVRDFLYCSSFLSLTSINHTSITCLQLATGLDCYIYAPERVDEYCLEKAVESSTQDGIDRWWFSGREDYPVLGNLKPRNQELADLRRDVDIVRIVSETPLQYRFASVYRSQYTGANEPPPSP